jgi:hypothetical protein
LAIGLDESLCLFNHRDGIVNGAALVRKGRAIETKSDEPEWG